MRKKAAEVLMTMLSTTGSATRVGTLLVSAAGSILLFSGLSGCNIVGPVAVLLEPDPTREAEYELPDRPTVVFVDDRKNVLNDRRMRVYIGDEVASRLMAEEIVTSTISSTSALRAVGNEEQGQLKSLEEIGRAVGAEQLIYVEMDSFVVQVVQGVPNAQATCSVKVIDCINRVKTFPEQDARTMIIELPQEQALEPVLTRASARRAEETLAKLIADKVAKLFYEHQTRPLGPQKPSGTTWN